MGSLEGRIAIVAGAGACGPGWGNGKAASVTFARAGARVMAIDIDETALGDTCDVIRGEGGVCEGFVGDVSDAARMREIIDGVAAKEGRIDILHNNVGVSAMGGPTDIDEDLWDRVLSVNLKGMFLACRYAIPVMEAQGGGVIVNAGSVSGIRYLGLPQIAYATSKGAIVTMTRAIAAQYGPKNIRANVIVAGIIDTPLLAVGAAQTFRTTFQVADPEEARRVRMSTIPLGHFGDAWDVANAALFLASDEARYITGTELVVDGGLTTQIQYPLPARG